MDNDDNPNVPVPIPVAHNEDAPFGTYLHEMDTDAFFNMRDWLSKAVTAKGATQIGAGIGMGQADIDIELDGHRYNISIRPLK